MDASTLVLINESYRKEGSEENIEGITVIIDGTMKKIFDQIKEKKHYGTYNEVLRDIIFEGINVIVKSQN